MTAAPRHQSSLEGLLDFAAQQPLFSNADKRARAIARFYRIVGHFEAIETATAATTTTTTRPGSQYNRPGLVRLTFEYARSPESQDRFLAFFFQFLAVDMLDGADDVIAFDPDLGESLCGVAEFLMTNFFLPRRFSLFPLSCALYSDFYKVRASSNKTPQPSPVHYAALQHVFSQEEQQRMQDFAGTPERLSALREACLVRDCHRCVVSRAFDTAEAIKRSEAITRFGAQGQALDDNGDPLIAGHDYSHVEVSHIIPYSLTRVERQDGTIDNPKKAAITILNMFDLGVVHLIEGPYMNRPYNAITLNLEMHQFFGQYKIFFARIPDTPPHTYQIGTFLPPLVSPLFPITRILFVHPTIDPPSERLLALHCAIAHILHLSGAGYYIDKILRDREHGRVCADGSTELGILVDLALRV